MPEVDSSAIAAVDYAVERCELTVQFKSGRTYVYFDVPQHVHTGLICAESCGRFFNFRIRDRFDFREIT